MENITWTQRRGQIKHLLYEMCLTGRIDRETLAEQFKDLNSVEPTKHGRWITEDDNVFECSNCGNLEVLMSKYCRRCGAIMDGGENDNR